MGKNVTITTDSREVFSEIFKLDSDRNAVPFSLGGLKLKSIRAEQDTPVFEDVELGQGGHFSHGPTSFKVEAVVIEQTPWNGEGLPPVGTVCEKLRMTSPVSRDYLEVKVIAHDEGGVVTTPIGDASKSYTWSAQDLTHLPFSGGVNAPRFRPLRTAEHIAAQERDDAVRQFCKATGANLAIAFAAYDAGYRKADQ